MVAFRISTWTAVIWDASFGSTCRRLIAYLETRNLGEISPCATHHGSTMHFGLALRPRNVWIFSNVAFTRDRDSRSVLKHPKSDAFLHLTSLLLFLCFIRYILTLLMAESDRSSSRGRDRGLVRSLRDLGSSLQLSLQTSPSSSGSVKASTGRGGAGNIVRSESTSSSRDGDERGREVFTPSDKVSQIPSRCPYG